MENEEKHQENVPNEKYLDLAHKLAVLAQEHADFMAEANTELVKRAHEIAMLKNQVARIVIKSMPGEQIVAEANIRPRDSYDFGIDGDLLFKMPMRKVSGTFKISVSPAVINPR